MAVGSNWCFVLAWFVPVLVSIIIVIFNKFSMTDLISSIVSVICSNKLQYSTKEGYSVFNGLAGFAIAQGVTLTAVAKGEGHDLLVVGIYAVAVALTAVWTSVLLWSKRAEYVGNPPARTVVWAFDRPTMVYGTFSLFWIGFVGAVMTWLGWEGLLPNQTARAYYNKGDAECDAWTVPERLRFDDGSQKLMDQWLEWIADSSSLRLGEQCIWVQAKAEFEQSYKPFTLELRCNKDYVFARRVAFLVKQARDEYRPTYRQIRFSEPGHSTTNSVGLDLADANRGERIVVLLFARDPHNPKQQPTALQFGFKLYAPYSGPRE